MLVLLLASLTIAAAYKTGKYQDCTCTKWKPMSNNPAKSICEEWTCKEHNSCFPAGAFVSGVEEEGQQIRMSDLRLGTMVRSAAGRLSTCLRRHRVIARLLHVMPECAGSVDRVTNFIHIDDDQEATFLRLISTKGTLELSPNHLVFTRAHDGSRQPVLAASVRIGDVLLHRNGDAQVQHGHASSTG